MNKENLPTGVGPRGHFASLTELIKQEGGEKTSSILNHVSLPNRMNTFFQKHHINTDNLMHGDPFIIGTFRQNIYISKVWDNMHDAHSEDIINSDNFPGNLFFCVEVRKKYGKVFLQVVSSESRHEIPTLSIFDDISDEGELFFENKPSGYYILSLKPDVAGF